MSVENLCVEAKVSPYIQGYKKGYLPSADGSLHPEWSDVNVKKKHHLIKKIYITKGVEIGWYANEKTRKKKL